MEWLRRTAGRVTTFGRDHDRAADVALAVVVGVLTTSGYVTADVEGSQRPQDVGAALIVVVLTALPGRRVTA
jgi:hypothetical protein